MMVTTPPPPAGHLNPALSRPWLFTGLAMLLLLCGSHATTGQTKETGFRFGATYTDVDIVRYEEDTTAAAFVIREFGERYYDAERPTMNIFRYHTRIKVVKPEGVKYGNVEFFLRKPRKARPQKISNIRASAFNLTGPSIVETKLDVRTILVDKVTKWFEVRKMFIPNVKPGTIIEYEYELESPFYFDFSDWDFQGEIPKMLSELRTNIPANMIFHVTFRGELSLSSNTNRLTDDCASSYWKCSESFYSMKNVPAFKEEPMMLPKANYLSSIDFEIAEYRYLDGRIDRFQRAWPDLERELRADEWFGVQLSRGKELMTEKAGLKLDNLTDSLTAARRIFDFVKEWYEWDGDFSFLTPDLKKAFDSKKGDAAEINMTLIALLREAGYAVEPVLLSTFDHGQPTDVQPVLGDFNYVIAKLQSGKVTYLLDATEDLLPFGVLPRRCLNGSGRVFSGTRSYWHDLKPAEKDHEASVINLTLGENGNLAGSIERTYHGYRAFQKRQELKSVGESQYIELLKKNSRYGINNVEFKNIGDLAQPLVETWACSPEMMGSVDSKRIQLNPFIVESLDSNPFKAETRKYHIELQTEFERSTLVTITYPPGYNLSEEPSNKTVTLPNSGGRFIYAAFQENSQVTINSSVILKKSTFSLEEYPYLRDLFAEAIQAQGVDLIFEKKK